MKTHTQCIRTLIFGILAIALTCTYVLPLQVHAADTAALEAAYDKALAQYNKGSTGFFESLKDSDPDAMEAWTYMTDMSGSHQYRTEENIRPYTDPSKSTDAASLENMKKALTYIYTTNKLRASDTTLGPVDKLYVTHALMAISQLHCNRSAHEIFHCRAYNVGENLVWGYDDPFEGWYTKEKKLYLEGNREKEEIGHYTNIMNAKYVTTGFAITQDADYDVCYEESFQYDNENKKTIEEYQKLFDAYYNKTVNALNDAKTALANATNCTGTFLDVPNTMWYYDVVERINGLGFMTGTDATHFTPNGNLTRAQAVTVLYRMARSPKTSGSVSFTDVKSDMWYTTPIIWANENGIATGYNSTTFGTNDPVTREQMCVMIQRFLKYMGLKTTEKASLDGFKDAGSIDAFAKDSVAYCVAKGIISGAENGTKINPTKTATRAESAKMFLKAYDLYA